MIPQWLQEKFDFIQEKLVVDRQMILAHFYVYMFSRFIEFELMGNKYTILIKFNVNDGTIVCTFDNDIDNQFIVRSTVRLLYELDKRLCEK